jgi:diadenosine tetraphosphatase ApaH/serine/threonine PP2A family protein phosphatase
MEKAQRKRKSKEGKLEAEISFAKLLIVWERKKGKHEGCCEVWNKKE